jgi:spore coat protein A
MMGLMGAAGAPGCVSEGPIRRERSRLIDACTPWTNPLPIPEVLTPKFSTPHADFYEITMKEADVPILCDGVLTRIWGYNGQYPGPTIKTQPGRKVFVKQKNKLSTPTSIHLHGGHTPPDSDGHPNDMIMPGESKIYRYPNTQVGTTLWYHDHVDMDTHFNVYMGLAGFYIIEDDDVDLPEAIPIVIQDRNFDDDGQLLYNPEFEETGEFFGDEPIVNGKYKPFIEVPAGKVRLRLLNGCNARFLRPSMSSDDLTFTIIGTEGGLLEAPRPNESSFPLAPAERMDVIVDFTGRTGETFTLDNAGSGNNNCATCPDMNEPLLQFIVGDPTDESDFEIPALLRPMTLLNPADAVRTRTFELNFNAVTNLWEIGGRSFNENPPLQVNMNDIEIWHFFNPSVRPHPMHIHLIQGQTLSTSEDDTPLSDEERKRRGTKETWIVPPTSAASGHLSVIAQWRSASEFAAHCNDFSYVFHCHKLEHEDMGMMDEFEVIDPDNGRCKPHKKHRRRHAGHGHHCHHDHGGRRCRCFRRGEGPGHHGDHDDNDDPNWFLSVDEES